MELSIPVTPSLLKKLQVLNVLSGDSGADFTTLLAIQVEHVVEMMIQEELLAISVVANKPANKAEELDLPTPHTGRPYAVKNDFSVADGLSSEDFALDEPEDEESEEFESEQNPPMPQPKPVAKTAAPKSVVAPVAEAKPKQQRYWSRKKKVGDSSSATVTKEMLEKDNKVENPKTEAVSSDDMMMTFEDLMGVSSTVNEDEQINDQPVFEIPEMSPTAVPRPNAKKLPNNCKATVSGYGGSEVNSF